MSCEPRQKAFLGLFVAVFVGAMWICTGWAPGITTYASIPVILSAEAIVLTMIYATIFHGETHEEEHPVITTSHLGVHAGLEKQLSNAGK